MAKMDGEGGINVWGTWGDCWSFTYFTQQQQPRSEGSQQWAASTGHSSTRSASLPITRS